MKKTILLSTQSIVNTEVERLRSEIKNTFQLSNTNLIHLPDNADLDNYWNPGCYICGTDVRAQTLVNIPETHAFRMHIIYGTSNYYSQQWVCIYNTGETWFRMGLNTEKIWGSWKKLYG